MNRRLLLQRAAALTAGLILPATLAENAEDVRRYWAIDRTMLPSDTGIDWDAICNSPITMAVPIQVWPKKLALPTYGVLFDDDGWELDVEFDVGE